MIAAGFFGPHSAERSYASKRNWFGTWSSVCQFGKYSIFSRRGKLHADAIGRIGPHDHINRKTFHGAVGAKRPAISFGDL
jgi:hypothetical protein